MPVDQCPKCRSAVPYPSNPWTPWRPNPECRCPNCAVILRRIHTGRSQFAKFLACAAFVITEFTVLLVNRDVLFRGDQPAIVRLGWIFILILIGYLMLMRWLTRYRLVARPEILLDGSDDTAAAKCIARGGLAMALLLLNLTIDAWALEPKNVFVISNRNVPDSQRIAEHYLVMRDVPKRNHLALDLPTSEDMTRAEYRSKLLKPLQRALILRRNEVKVLLTVYGVPLRVGPKIATEEEQESEKKLSAELKTIDAGREVLEAARLQEQIQKVSAAESQAAVDSELMLLWWPDYPLARWMVNPLYFAIPEEQRRSLPETVMTSRLDGPSAEVALGLINDAVAVEQRGLKGKVYIDARGIPFDAKQPGENGTGYSGYDQSFREAAQVLEAARLDVTLNNQQALFAPGSCPDCAIYAGWYSLANYTPAFEFTQGAVAWHLASSEAVSLRNPNAKFWCPNLLKDGAAVTMGPVAEPYTIGFPKPAEFFAFLATGKYTVVECYAKTIMLASWMGVLIGDPLYNPFGKTPLIDEASIRTSPQGIGVEFKQVP